MFGLMKITTHESRIKEITRELDIKKSQAQIMTEEAEHASRLASELRENLASVRQSFDKIKEEIARDKPLFSHMLRVMPPIKTMMNAGVRFLIANQDEALARKERWGPKKLAKVQQEKNEAYEVFRAAINDLDSSSALVSGNIAPDLFPRILDGALFDTLKSPEELSRKGEFNKAKVDDNTSPPT